MVSDVLRASEGSLASRYSTSFKGSDIPGRHAEQAGVRNGKRPVERLFPHANSDNERKL